MLVSAHCTVYIVLYSSKIHCAKLCCLHSYLFSYKIKEIQNRFILIYRESKKTYDITILVFGGLWLLIYLSSVF